MLTSLLKILLVKTHPQVPLLIPRLIKKIRKLIPGPYSSMGQYLERLGEGSYGAVYKFKREDEFFAIKVFNRHECAFGVPSASEMAFAMNFNHPHIIKHHEIMYNPQKDSFKLLMELADMDLYKLVTENKPSRESCYNYFLQLCSAVKYLHDANIAHFDIKPFNCLIKDGVLKLCDFGLSRFTFVKETDLRPTLAAPETYYLMGDSSRYVHPIYNKSRHCPKSADMWSLGETFFFMLTGKLMFAEHKKGMLEKAKFSKGRGKFLQEHSLSELEIDLLLSLLEINMDNRASIERVIQHKLFASLVFPFYEPLSLPSLTGSIPKDNSIMEEFEQITSNWKLSSSLIKATETMFYHLYAKHRGKQTLLWVCCLYLCSKIYNGCDLLIGDMKFLLGRKYTEKEMFTMESAIFMELQGKCVFSL